MHFPMQDLPDKKCTSLPFNKTGYIRIWALKVLDRIRWFRNNSRPNNATYSYLNVQYCNVLIWSGKRMCILVLCTVFNNVWVDLLANHVNAKSGALWQNMLHMHIHNIINSLIARIHQPDAYSCFLFLFFALRLLILWLLRTNQMRCDVNYLFFIPH